MVTALSHKRAFLIEVMGRNRGFLALMAGNAGGAEAIVIPEVESDPEVLATELRSTYERGQAHALVVVAEGAKHNAAALADYFVEGKLMHKSEGVDVGYKVRVQLVSVDVQQGFIDFKRVGSS